MRRLFTALAALSLLMCVATAGLWVRSYWWEDELHIYHDPIYESLVESNRGWLSATYIETYLDRQEAKRAGLGEGPTFEVRPAEPYPDLEESTGFVAGFRYLKGRAGIWSTSAVHLAHAWLVAAFAILPAVWLIRWRRRRRILPGHCKQCGYDLRASPERCPECGAAAEVPGPTRAARSAAPRG